MLGGQQKMIEIPPKYQPDYNKQKMNNSNFLHYLLAYLINF